MRVFLLLLALLLAGCATAPERAPVADIAAAWNARQARLARLETWSLRGRLALRTAEEGAHASLHWVRRQDVHRVDLAGPFGGGRVRVTYDGSGAELREADGKVHRDASVQELVARATGWWLPLEGLNYWVVGLPAPGAPAQRALDPWGRLQRLRQLGWTIEFLEYVREGGYELPRRLFIRRASPEETLEVRLVIEDWAVR